MKNLKNNYNNIYSLVLFVVLTLTGCNSTHSNTANDSVFKTRGIILDVNDLSTVDWPKKAKEAGLTTIGTHITPSQVAEFFQTEKGKQFLKECKDYGIEIEHELHAMHDLLPRELFEVDSTMFRMDEHGKRKADFNLCVHSEKALETVANNAVKYAKILPSTTNRYYFWIDDGQPMCHCNLCKEYSDSEQALILENQIVKALKHEINPKASLAHLAYVNTLDAPRKVKPEPGIFLEFAPIHRTWDKPLTEGSALGWDKNTPITHAKYLEKLDENLAVFPVETAQVLEYWLDVSLFSKWKKPAVELPWHNDVFLKDIDVYAKRGIRNITSFAVYMDADYFQSFPNLNFLSEYAGGLKNYKNK